MGVEGREKLVTRKGSPAVGVVVVLVLASSDPGFAPAIYPIGLGPKVDRERTCLEITYEGTLKDPPPP